MLGYNNPTISPREIWEAVAIVDTEFYRQLMVSLQQIGVLTSVINKERPGAVARRRKAAVKNIAGFAISAGTSPAKAELVQQADIGLPERLPFDTDTDDYARVAILQTEASSPAFDIRSCFGEADQRTIWAEEINAAFERLQWEMQRSNAANAS